MQINFNHDTEDAFIIEFDSGVVFSCDMNSNNVQITQLSAEQRSKLDLVFDKLNLSYVSTTLESIPVKFQLVIKLPRNSNPLELFPKEFFDILSQS